MSEFYYDIDKLYVRCPNGVSAPVDGSLGYEHHFSSEHIWYNRNGAGYGLYWLLNMGCEPSVMYEQRMRDAFPDQTFQAIYADPHQKGMFIIDVVHSWAEYHVVMDISSPESDPPCYWDARGYDVTVFNDTHRFYFDYQGLSRALSKCSELSGIDNSCCRLATFVEIILQKI